MIIPSAISTNIPATMAKGRNCNALEKKNAEKIPVNNPINHPESLVVAPELIFIVVLGTKALTGIPQTSQVIILVSHSPYTSR